MSEYRRIKMEGGTYFFTVNAHRRQPILTDDLIRQALREGIHQARQTYHLKLKRGYCCRTTCIVFGHPVKHGHVRRVSDWPYSTFHRFVKNGFYPPDWGGDGMDEITDADFGE